MKLAAEMMEEALRTHGDDIKPCSGKEWVECYTELCGNYILWYNTPDGTTHNIMRKMHEHNRQS